MEPRKNLRIVTIHGTFAPDADWVEPGYWLWDRLAKRLGRPLEVIPFRWSGGNSHEERQRWGAKLREFLGELAEGGPALLVAHSHGGNVAAYALGRRSPSEPAVAGLVSLATPFLKVRRREVRGWISLLSKVLPRLILYPPLFVLVWWLVHWGARKGGFWAPAGYVALVVVTWWWAGRLLQRLLRFRLGRFVLRKQGRLARRLQLPSLEKPVLALGVRFDEAALWLRALYWAAELPFRLWHPTVVVVLSLLWPLPWLLNEPTPAAQAASGTVPIVVPFLNLVIGGWGQAGGLPIANQVVPLAMLTILLATLVYPLGVVSAAALLTLLFQGWTALWSRVLRGHGAGYGEGLLDNWLLNIVTVALPALTRELAEYRVVSAGGIAGLRHSALYRNPETVDHLAEWIPGLGV